MLGPMTFRLSVNITPAVGKSPRALADILLDVAVAVSEMKAYEPLSRMRLRDADDHLCGFWHVEEQKGSEEAAGQ